MSNDLKRRPRLAAAGQLSLIVLLPALVYYLWICATSPGGGLIVPVSLAEWRALTSRVAPPGLAAAAVVLGWFAWQALLHVVLPGRWQLGHRLAGGQRLAYKLNGWAAWWTTWLVLAAAWLLGLLDAPGLVSGFGAVLTSANLFTFGLALVLWRTGGGRGPVSFFEGARLNPRTGWFDWKFFCEARPGLVGWAVVDVALLLTQYERHGSVSAAMVLVVAFQLWYVTDFFLNEEKLLSTWDIKHERFGWMLVWGDLVFVPVGYSLQAWYLVDHSPRLGTGEIAGLVALNLLGYWIFRSANAQKHRFREHPEALIGGRRPRFVQTADGARLLTSGWWGRARHANYLGDLLMAAAWCLPCGFGSPVPYFYLVFLGVLLVHRERRDHHRCALKYGADWERYCARVPHRIVPWLY